MSYFNKPILEDYADCQRMFSNVRTPAKGKPIRTWCRLYKDEDVYSLRWQNWDKSGGDIIARFYPDGSIELPSNTSSWWGMHTSLSSALHRVIPIITERKGKGRFRIAHTGYLDRVTPPRTDNRNYYHEWWDNFRREGVEYFGGMMFNTDGECINMKYASDGEVDTEKRKVWLRMLKRFKRGLKARAKVGALQPIANRIYQKHKELEAKGCHRWQWQMPNWRSDKYLNMLEDALQTNEFTPEFLEAFVESATPNTYGNTLATDEHILKYVDTLMADVSFELRRRFGVFIEVPTNADGTERSR